LGSRTHRVRSVEVDTDRSGEGVFPLVGVQTTLATSDSINNSSRGCDSVQTVLSQLTRTDLLSEDVFEPLGK